MRVRPLLIACVLLVGSLAGCIGGDDADSGTDLVENNDSGNESFDLPEGREGGAAYEETNQTEGGVGGMSHDHDYWQGKERITVFETTASMEPYPDENGNAYAEFRIPQPGLVFEGTGQVDFTITNPQRHACEGEEPLNGEWICTTSFGLVPPAPEPNPPGGMKLQYKHAATSEWIDAGEIQWDTPTTLQVTDPAQTDMPHSSASLWQFRVTSPNEHDTTLLFDASAQIVKAGEIVKWPGHPDFYAEQTWRKVMQQTGHSEDAGRDVNALGDTVEQTDVLVPEKLISWGTQTLYVWVNITSVDGARPPTHWYLEFHNASGDWRFTDLFDDTYATGETSYLWKINVTDDGMDSPYSAGSRWEFIFRGAYSTDIVAFEKDVVQYTVDYDMTILATNEELKPEEYGRLL